MLGIERLNSEGCSESLMLAVGAEYSEVLWKSRGGNGAPFIIWLIHVTNSGCFVSSCTKELQDSVKEVKNQQSANGMKQEQYSVGTGVLWVHHKDKFSGWIPVP